MHFEWDAAKAKRNLEKHGVPFEYATEAFYAARRVDQADTRREYGEQRRVICGRIDGVLFVVSYTMRGETVRLISARKANRKEVRKYDPG